MQNLLNFCAINQDIKTAMRIGNMANTFHKLVVEPSINETGQQPVAITTRLYLQQDPCLRNHSIWRQEGFWDSALFIGIAAELDHREAVLWDDLPVETLREEVVGIHNIVFGQLGTMAVTMHEVGLSHVEVAKKLTKMSRLAQLNEDQIFELLKTARSTFQTKSPSTVDATEPEVNAGVQADASIMSYQISSLPPAPSSSTTNSPPAKPSSQKTANTANTSSKPKTGLTPVKVQLGQADMDSDEYAVL